MTWALCADIPTDCLTLWNKEYERICEELGQAAIDCTSDSLYDTMAQPSRTNSDIRDLYAEKRSFAKLDNV